MKNDKPFKKKYHDNKGTTSDSTFRLNKFVANAGICSRREADKLIAQGLVKVNDVVITEMGFKVGYRDKVEYNNRRIYAETKRYVLINKPKNFITTTKDEKDRRTVMALIEKACEERLYPVGRLDRNTTGLLLLTNDGELTKRLTHPSFGVKKTYHIVLNKELTDADFLKIKTTGVELEEGIALPDELSWVGEGEDKKEVGITIHIGWNRVIRRMFEALDYEVEKLDRVIFGSLTKKNLPRGHWRHLRENEIIMLKRITRNLDKNEAEVAKHTTKDLGKRRKPNDKQEETDAPAKKTPVNRKKVNTKSSRGYKGKGNKRF
jgi:23S rRNA pseudouridine2605 synthase